MEQREQSPGTFLSRTNPPFLAALPFDMRWIATYGCADDGFYLPVVSQTDDEDLNMYPVIPMEMNQFAADSLLYLFAAVSAMLSAVYCLR